MTTIRNAVQDQYFVRTFKVTLVMLLLTGIATWVSSIGGFIRWMAHREGERLYSISDLLFEIIMWRDILYFGGIWLVGFMLVYWAVYGVARSHRIAFRIDVGGQVVLGSIYIVVMFASTAGLWSS